MTPFKVEAWTWYSFVILIVFIRFASRWILLGSPKHFYVEDWLMLVIFIFYTSVIVTCNIISTANTNLIPAEAVPSLKPADIRARIYGSRVQILNEQSILLTVWGCKACLLLMYSKITMGLKQHLAVTIAAVYTGLALLIIEIMFFGVWCVPFSQYWAVPPKNPQCATWTHHYILQATFNISSDSLLLCIILPLIFKVHFPFKRKALLFCLFGLGAFAIIAAALNKYSSFAHPYDPNWIYWYCRESSTAMLVTNLPHCWTLLRYLFNLSSFSAGNSSDHPSKFDTGFFSHPSRFVPSFRSHDGENGLSRLQSTRRSMTVRRANTTESQEDITKDIENGMPLQIWQQLQVTREVCEDGSIQPGHLRPDRCEHQVTVISEGRDYSLDHERRPCYGRGRMCGTMERRGNSIPLFSRSVP